MIFFYRNVSPVIVIRKYYNIKQQHEFRCFVVDNELVGMIEKKIALFLFLFLINCFKEYLSVIPLFTSTQLKRKRVKLKRILLIFINLKLNRKTSH